MKPFSIKQLVNHTRSYAPRRRKRELLLFRSTSRHRMFTPSFKYKNVPFSRLTLAVFLPACFFLLLAILPRGGFIFFEGCILVVKTWCTYTACRTGHTNSKVVFRTDPTAAEYVVGSHVGLPNEHQAAGSSC